MDFLIKLKNLLKAMIVYLIMMLKMLKKTPMDSVFKIGLRIKPKQSQIVDRKLMTQCQIIKKQLGKMLKTVLITPEKLYQMEQQQQGKLFKIVQLPLEKMYQMEQHK